MVHLEAITVGTGYRGLIAETENQHGTSCSAVVPLIFINRYIFPHTGHKR